MNVRPSNCRPGVPSGVGDARTDVDVITVSRRVSSDALMENTGLALSVCETFHVAFVDLIEDVGDFDGLIVTPNVVILGRHDRVDAALAWLARRLRASRPTMSTADARMVAPDDDSLHLGFAVGSNPSLTFAFETAVAAYLLGDVLDSATHCGPARAEQLTTAAIELLRAALHERVGSVRASSTASVIVLVLPPVSA